MIRYKDCSCWKCCSFKILVVCSSLSARQRRRKPTTLHCGCLHTYPLSNLSVMQQNGFTGYGKCATLGPLRILSHVKCWKALKAVHWTPGYHIINMISADFPNAFFWATQENLVTYSKSCFSSMLSALTYHLTYLSWSVQFNSTHQTLLSRAAMYQACCEVSVIYLDRGSDLYMKTQTYKDKSMLQLVPFALNPLPPFSGHHLPLGGREITGFYC